MDTATDNIPTVRIPCSICGKDNEFFQTLPTGSAFGCIHCHGISTFHPKPTPGHPYRLEDLQPMRDRLLVAPLAVSSRTLGGLHMPESSHQRERPQHGIVLMVGPGAWNKDGTARVPVQAQPGDCVFYGKYSGQEFVLGDRSVLNMGEIEVFSLLPAPAFVVVEHDNPKHNHLQGDYCDLCASPDEQAAAAALQLERERLVSEQAAGAQALDGGLQPVPGILESVEEDVSGPAAAAEVTAKSALDQERERLRRRRRES